ncbi:MAG: TIGR03085 family metal-binding protein [Propioniciclava sp.]|uniref:TIGR03085 family metal-binding protein n=1 Tax=Propioniciclava sp. TaxID=2038686 RepID=UPI0039E6C491
MGFARQERTALCDALEAAGPDAPTLCEGWTAHDLAAHLWVRENDPSALPGMFLAALADVTDARMHATKRRWTYPELIHQIRRGPRPISVFAVPVLDELANTAEFFVHTEDVRRPAGLPPRDLGVEFEDTIAKSLNTTAKTLFRGAPCGVVLERTDRGQKLRVKPGESTVTVIGKPSELLLFAFGRRADADVRLVGDPGAEAALLDR